MAVPVVASFTVATDDNVDGISSPAEPTGVANNDLLIVIAGNDSTSGSAQYDDTTNKPTGFTLIGTAGSSGSDTYIAAFWKIADGTEADPLAVPHLYDDGNRSFAYYIRVTGADTTTPIDASVVQNQGSDPNHDIDPVTSTVDDCLILAGWALDGGDGGTFTTASSGWSITDGTASTGTGPIETSGGFAEKDLASLGSAGTLNIAHTSANDGFASVMFSIAPGAGGSSIIPQAMHHYRNNSGSGL